MRRKHTIYTTEQAGINDIKGKICFQKTLMLVNGTHHMSALFAAGWDYAPALLRPVTSMYDCGFLLNDNCLAYEQQALARPPFLCDFFAKDLALHFQQLHPNQPWSDE